jgi:hypothetical protein
MINDGLKKISSNLRGEIESDNLGDSMRLDGYGDGNAKE